MRELLALAYPMVISQGAFALMIFTDRYFMSSVSPTHLAAALGGGVASYFCLSLFIGVLSYGNALVAQYYGARELAKCPRVQTQGLLMCLVFVPALLFISVFVSKLFTSMGHSQALAALEETYFELLIWGSAISLCKTSLGSYFAGIGQTRVLMVADALGVLLNLPLTYALVFGVWGLGSGVYRRWGSPGPPGPPGPPLLGENGVGVKFTFIHPSTPSSLVLLPQSAYYDYDLRSLMPATLSGIKPM